MVQTKDHGERGETGDLGLKIFRSEVPSPLLHCSEVVVSKRVN